MSAQKIKNCPYCGGVGHLRYIEISGLFIVECAHCVNKGFYAPTTTQAIEIWNERAEIKKVKF